MSSEPHWTEPGAYEVAAGVHRIPLPLPMDGLRAVNVYAIETEEGLTLVDGGWAIASARTQLEQSLRTIGHHPRDIRSFLVTHAHRDHYTQAVAIRAEFGRAVVALGIGDRETLDVVASAGELPYAARLRSCGAPTEAQWWEDWAVEHGQDAAIWQAPDEWLERESELEVGGRRLLAVPTPGHTAGHYVFADQEAALLFAGDHILPTITPSIGFEPRSGVEAPLADYLASLARVRAMPDLRLLPAHGAVTESSHTRIDELVQHHELRLARSFDAVQGGASTPYDVARVLGWTRHDRSFCELEDFDRGLATLETKFHLDVLAIRGELTRQCVGGTWHYESRKLT